MDDPLGVREGERVGDVAGDVERGLERELALAQQPVPQRLALDVRHHVVEQPGGLPGGEDRHDVGVAELGGEVHLTDEPLAQQPVAQLGGDDLDRDPAVRVLLDGQKDPGHAAGADLAFDVIVRGEAGAQRVEGVEHQRQLSARPRTGRARRVR